MNDSNDLSDNKQNESIDEVTPSNTNTTTTNKRTKNIREASKKVQKLIDHIVNDEDIIENPIASSSTPSLLSSSTIDKKTSQHQQKTISASHQQHQSSFIAPTHNYRSTLSSSSFNRAQRSDTYLNIPNLSNRLAQKSAKEGVTIEQSNEMIKFINNGLETYLKNSLEKLIQINRRRTSYAFPHSAYHKKITIQSFDSKAEITNVKPFQKKIEFIPYKKFSIFYTRNVNRNIQFIERYRRVLSKDKDKDKERDNGEAKVDNSISDNVIVKDANSNNSNDKGANDDKEALEMDCCIYNNYDITRNIKLKVNKKRYIELKDLIKFLEEENRTPLQRALLHKAYILLTMPKG